MRTIKKYRDITPDSDSYKECRTIKEWEDYANTIGIVVEKVNNNLYLLRDKRAKFLAELVRVAK